MESQSAKQISGTEAKAKAKAIRKCVTLPGEELESHRPSGDVPVPLVIEMVQHGDPYQYFGRNAELVWPVVLLHRIAKMHYSDRDSTGCVTVLYPYEEDRL